MWWCAATGPIVHRGRDELAREEADRAERAAAEAAAAVAAAFAGGGGGV